MTVPGPFVADRDFALYLGDVREVLPRLPAGSVDCVVTSPPYWGLRDYGTGSWDGGNPDCDHKAPPTGGPNPERYTPGGGEMFRAGNDKLYQGECGKCGARRVDQQIGLEPTPEQFVAQMVQVFREVRRVLAPHGTLWLNLGDSYASGEVGRVDAPAKNALLAETQRPRAERRITQRSGLKPKDLVGIPWRVAFALQADGWYLRADIVWSKPNPMPESVTDRPTKSHEYVFLLSKQPRYFFDQEAVREPNSDWTEKALAANWERRTNAKTDSSRKDAESLNGAGLSRAHGLNPAGRNVRSVWEIATQPYPEAHFATFPEALPERCIKAGCPEQVCVVCGKPRERIVEVGYAKPATGGSTQPPQKRGDAGRNPALRTDTMTTRLTKRVETLGFTDCGHGNYRVGVVLDPFLGSGTVALVARRLGRRSIGVELSPEYAALAARRLQQLSLLAEGAV